MSIRQDFKVKAYFDEASGNLTSVYWTNPLDQPEAPGNLPAQVVYDNGIPVSASWMRRGKLHRENDLPAKIYFDDQGRPRSWRWYQDGLEHRENDKPANIHFTDGSLTTLIAIEFFQRGEHYRMGGEHPAYFFEGLEKAFPDENDGSPEITFEGFDPSWLSSPAPTLDFTPQPRLIVAAPTP